MCKRSRPGQEALGVSDDECCWRRCTEGVEEGSTLGDGCLTQRDQANGETRDHAVKALQSLVAAKVLEFLPC